MHFLQSLLDTHTQPQANFPISIWRLVLILQCDFKAIGPIGKHTYIHTRRTTPYTPPVIHQHKEVIYKLDTHSLSIGSFVYRSQLKWSLCLLDIYYQLPPITLSNQPQQGLYSQTHKHTLRLLHAFTHALVYGCNPKNTGFLKSARY